MEGRIIINDRQYSLTEFSELSSEKVPLFAQSSQVFVKDWLNGKSTFFIKTSGSTGNPKTIEIKRSQMVASAQHTITALGLESRTNALLAMSPERIGGRMMLVRAMIGDWNLTITEPSTALEETLKSTSFDFTALVPLQVQALLNSGNKPLLEAINCILIGGAPLSNRLEEELMSCSNQIYHTYGMTETISHIALRKLSPDPSEYFRVIGDNEVSINADGCLKTKGTVSNNEWIQTNDLVELDGKRFKWLGRTDLTINSGGIKLQIESIEEELRSLIPHELNGNLCIWKAMDEMLGEKVICVCDSEELINYFVSNEASLKSSFTPYARPKKWRIIPELVLTESGKIDREKSFQGSEVLDN